MKPNFSEWTAIEYAFEEIFLNAEMNSSEDYDGENQELREMFYSAFNYLNPYKD